MPIYVFDTSGLVKRYAVETGSAWVQSLIHPSAGNTIWVADITGAEMISAITRKRRRGEIAATDEAAAIAAFRADFAAAYFVFEISRAVTARAMDLAERHGLRGYDAVQLAVALGLCDQCRALGLPEPSIVTADRELYAAAVAEGLPAEDPNAHP